ncbi:MAG: dehydrogenase, partial [Isosphaeraceae bacterium]|nr:dehydrogenase [Isosphaeraceae bacterium]
YCGIHYFDSPAYPEEYRGTLFLGNIHGNCINNDFLVRNGATYVAKARPDFLTANDAWFMPVVQKTGPDGCLYILDWYDRYHCYQDANRDPAGIDRLKGRLYRVRYRGTPRRWGFDLAREDDSGLLKLLASPNVYDRDIAQRLLVERNHPEARPALEALILDPTAPRKARMHALWALVGTGTLDPACHKRLLDHDDPAFRAWGVRAAGNKKQVEPAIREKISAMAQDASPDVRLQVAIAARKIEGLDPIPLLYEVLSASADDPLIPQIVWQNLHPLLEEKADALLARIERADLKTERGALVILPRVVERLLSRKDPDPAPIARLVALLAHGRSGDPDAARQCLATIAAKIQTGEVAGDRLARLRARLGPVLAQTLSGPDEGPLALDAALLAASWKDRSALGALARRLESRRLDEPTRFRILDALIAAGEPGVFDAVARWLRDPEGSTPEFRGRLLAALGRLDDPRVAELVLAHYPRLEPELQPRAIELLTQRPAWARALLAAVKDKAIPASAININQLRKLQASKDAEVVQLARATLGTAREGRDPNRDAVLRRMREHLRKNPGDPIAGRSVFQKLCAQCHKIYGEGQDVGPDLTSNGRASFEQLLSNIFDPNLVIGPGYQAMTVATTDGRVLTGLIAEDSPQRLVLKVQGGKVETIPRAEVEEAKLSPLSLMPEDLETQLTLPEWSDLFAFLTLDRPPGDPSAKLLPGTRAPSPRQTTDPAQFGSLLDEFAPGFTTRAVGAGGLAILAEYRGRAGVLRTHPVDRNTPCILRAQAAIPEGKTTRLALDVSHDPRGDWELVVKANGRALRTVTIGPETATRNGWAEITVDLTEFAGHRVSLE